MIGAGAGMGPRRDQVVGRAIPLRGPTRVVPAEEGSMKASELWREFKGFALKGNLVDLAVAVIIGNAFGAVISSLVENILMPLLSYITPAESYRSWHVGRVQVGLFLGTLLNFLLISLAVFAVIVKLLGTIRKIGLLPAPDEPTTKECPFCLSVIPTRARKCSHCTADLPEELHRTED
jgi:large conductance mechanosensitive channel